MPFRIWNEIRESVSAFRLTAVCLQKLSMSFYYCYFILVITGPSLFTLFFISHTSADTVYLGVRRTVSVNYSIMASLVTIQLKSVHYRTKFRLNCRSR